MKGNDQYSWRQVPSLPMKSQALQIRAYRYVEGEVQHIGDCIFEHNVTLGDLQDKLADLQSLSASVELDDCSVKEASVFHAW